MADQLSAAEIQQFTAAFGVIDLDGGGTIELRELMTCAHDFGFEISLDELREIVRLVDTDGGGEIDIDEYLEIMGLMLYRHKLESSDDDDDDDGTGASGASGDHEKDVNAFLSGDGTFSSAASPEEKTRAQQIMKARAAWAAEAVETLHAQIQAVQEAENAVNSPSSSSSGFGSANEPGEGSASAVFQMRKQQEAAQAAHRIAEAAAERLVKRILLEAQAKGITTHQLPQIETLELEDDPAAAAASPTREEEEEQQQQQQNKYQPQSQYQTEGEGGDDNNKSGGGKEKGLAAVQPAALLVSLQSLAKQLKNAADALGANLVPMSMVKTQHTRGGPAAVLKNMSAVAASSSSSSSSASRQRRNNNTRKKEESAGGEGKQLFQQQQQQQQQTRKQRGGGGRGGGTRLLVAPEIPGARPTVNKRVLQDQLAALEALDADPDEDTNSNNNNNNNSKSNNNNNNDLMSSASAELLPKLPEGVSAKTMSLITGRGGDGSERPGEKSSGSSSSSSQQQLRTSEQLRAVVKQVLRSWAFPITPVCQQMDLMDDRWKEFNGLIQGQEALTRPACDLGRACPDRYNHAHRRQLTHPCYCRIDRFSGDKFDPTGEKEQQDDHLQPLSEASLCPHMVRSVHGNCYTHLPPPKDELPPAPASALASPMGSSLAASLSPPSSSPLAGSVSASPNSPTKTPQITAAAKRQQSKDARLGELIALVGRLDLTNIELGGIGAQAVAFVIANEIAAQDEESASGFGSPAGGMKYSTSALFAGSNASFSPSFMSSSPSATFGGGGGSSSSSAYKFKDLVLSKCCVPPAGAIAIFRIAHNLRSLDVSNNILGQKTVIPVNEKESSSSSSSSPSSSPSSSNTTSAPSTQAATASAGGMKSRTSSSATVAAAASGGLEKEVSRDLKKQPVYSSSSSAPTTTTTTAGGGGEKQQQQDEPRKEQAPPPPAALVVEESVSVPSLMGTHIREVLFKNGNLTSLNLSGNRLTDSDGLGVCEGLKQNVVLRVLDISRNEFGPRFGRDLASAMADNLDLRVLRLGYNPMEATGTLSLLEELKNNSVLEEIDLTWTGMGPQAGVLLGEMISQCGSLLRVYAGHNAMQLNGMIAIGKALPNAFSLQHLDVSHNVVAELGVVELLNGLRTNSSLVTLDLRETTGGASENVMKEIALVTAERLSKLPANTPQTNVLFGVQMTLPSHLAKAEEPFKLPAKKPPASPSGKKGSKGVKKPGSASSVASSQPRGRSSARK